MAEEDLLWMSVVVFLPSAFALALLLFPRGKEQAMCWWSLAGTALTLGVSIGMFIHFKNDTIDRHVSGDATAARKKGSLDWRAEKLEGRAAVSPETADAGPAKSDNWVARYPWIERFNIYYYLGVDGISMPLVLLTTLLCFLAMVASFNIKRYESTERFVKGYCMLFLILETGMLGTFLALDFFLFYIFWEVMLLPMYFLIGVWGGPRREYAAVKFFLYTLLGSVLILIALLGFYFTDVHDFVSGSALQKEVERSNVPAVKEKVEAHNKARTARNAAQASLETKAKDAKTTLKEARAELAAFRQAAAAERQAATAVEKAKQGVVVNSFDLVLLARVGRTALEVLRNRDGEGALPASVPSLKRAEAAVATAKDKLDLHKAPAGRAREEVEKAKQAAAAARARLANAKGDLTALEQEQKKRDAEAIQGELKSVTAVAYFEDARSGLQRAQDNLAATREGVSGRLKQPFFTPAFQYTMFVLLFIGFAIKVPVFPFHTWLPDAHVEAPTPISMILAGVLLKLGGYGIIRIAYPICPWAAEQLALWVALFGVINIVYGAFAAMAQTDFKKLVAYSSVSHMGYVILGIAVWSSPENRAYWAWGMNGAMFQMIAHGITSAGMFFCVGVIYDRAHHRNLDNFRGLYEPMPLYGGISAVIFFAAMGLPGMCGFVGEFMVVLSTWSFAPDGAAWVGKLFAILSALTVVLTAAYILWTLQRVFMGTNPTYKNYPDVTVPELSCIIPLVVLSVVLGVAPALLLNWMEPSVTNLVDTLASLK